MGTEHGPTDRGSRTDTIWGLPAVYCACGAPFSSDTEERALMKLNRHVIDETAAP